MGLEVSEATVLDLLVAVGDEVSEDQPLLEIETEKATTEVLAPCAGFVIAIEVAAGDEVPVGAVVAYIGESADARPGEGAPAPAASDAAAPSAVPEEDATESSGASPPPEVAPAGG
ncbi:MAG TPA: biotin/lipoyl-containing protein, partial [Baekduia sp.]|nr:biotin/lipoyl-containing protein [Baekduia sp.]